MENNSNSIKLSIIVPGKDDARHLERSLGGILKTRPEGVELIYVDDASSDASSILAEKICEGKPLTKIIKLENSVGAGGARNVGSRAASGEYLYYHDSDDYMSEDGIKRILEVIERGENPDMIIVPFRIVKNEGYEDQKTDRFTKIEETGGWAVGPWSAVIRRELFHAFPENMYAEDVIWHFVQYDRFEKFAKVEGDPVYFWDCTNPTAVSRTTEWFWRNSRTLEDLAFSNVLVNNGLRDKYVSDSLRCLAMMYDIRLWLHKDWVKRAWSARFLGTYQKMMTGHFGH